MFRFLLLIGLLCSISLHAQQQIMVTPNPVIFQDVAVGKSADTVLTMVNYSTRDLTVRMYFTGPDAVDFELTQGPSVQIKAGQGYVQVPVRFTPSHGDTSYAQLMLSTDSSITTQPVNLYGVSTPTFPGGLQVLPKQVQFRNVIVGRSVDAIFTVNSSTVITMPIMLTFSTPTSSPFSIVSPTSPVEITSKGSVNCVIRFSPTAEGRFASVINVMANGAVISVPIEGTAEPSQLSITWEEGDFVADTIGASVSRTIIVTNNGSDDSLVSVFTSRGYTFKAEPEELYLMSGQSGTSVITFTPTDMDTTTEGLEVVRSGMSEYSLQLIGYVRSKPSVRVRVGDVSGKPGESAPCVITLLTDIPDKTMSATMTLSFNASVLVPNFTLLTDGTANGIRTVSTRVGVPSTRKSGDVLASLPFTIALGDATTSPIQLKGIVWRGVDDIEIPMNTTAEDATTTVDDDREVNANTGGMKLSLAPNPMTTSATATVYGAQGALVVELFSTTGVRVYSTSLTASADGTTVLFDRSSLSQGLYILRVSNGASTLVRRLVVE
ncbi:MAG: T9SS type A sorting domain-containing protein [Bacteroidetes bacterium]|nr:T9SS type A sorting domain-containing protein [Bacteroidota bacterium]